MKKQIVIALILVGILSVLWYGEYLGRDSFIEQYVRVEPEVINCSLVALQDARLPEYINKKFCFAINYRVPWRIAENLSRADEVRIRRFGLYWIVCDKNNDRCRQKAEVELEKFSNKWRIDETEAVMLTDLNEEQENQYLGQYHGPVTIFPLPNGHSMEIRVSAEPVDFEREKDPGYQWTRLKNITLRDGTRAQQTDIRRGEGMGGDLVVVVPYLHNARVSWNYKGDYTARSLKFSTSVSKDSEAEKIFFEVVNSLRFR